MMNTRFSCMAAPCQRPLRRSGSAPSVPAVVDRSVATLAYVNPLHPRDQRLRDSLNILTHSDTLFHDNWGSKAPSWGRDSRRARFFVSRAPTLSAGRGTKGERHSSASNPLHPRDQRLHNSVNILTHSDTLKHNKSGSRAQEPAPPIVNISPTDTQKHRNPVFAHLRSAVYSAESRGQLRSKT